MIGSGTPAGPVGAAPDLQKLSDPERVASVASLVAHGPVDPGVQVLVSLSAALLDTQFAQVSLIGGVAEVAAATHGFVVDDASRATPIALKLCGLTAAFAEPLVVPDAAKHLWVQDLEPVRSGALGSYLGVPLRNHLNQVVGTLCVFDPQPRVWEQAHVETLKVVAIQVSAALDHQAAEGKASAGAIRHELVAAAADLGGFDIDLSNGDVVWDDRMRALHGYDAVTGLSLRETYQQAVDPLDHERVREVMAQARAVLGDFVVDYRINLPDGSLRWLTVRGRVLPDMLGNAARIVGAAYDCSAERDLSDELSRLLETIPVGFHRCTADWTLTFINGAAEKMLSASRHDLIGRSLWEAFPGVRGTEFETAYRRAQETGFPEVVTAFFAPLASYFEIHVWPDAHGLSFFCQDVSNRYETQLALAVAGTRLARLANGGARLAATLSPSDVLAVLTDLLVPDLASSVVVAVVPDVASLLGQTTSDDAGQLYPVLVTHADPELQPVLRQVVERSMLHTNAGDGVGVAIHIDRSQSPSQSVRALSTAQGVDDERLAHTQALSAGPVLTVPLRTPAGVFGTLTVRGAEGGTLDEVLLSELANRAATALDLALTFGRQSREVATLQRGLLPAQASAPPGVTIATRYLPADTSSLAGGDFYKTIEVDGRLLCVLGDVMGHGTESAARAGQLHSVISALALEGHGPAALLERLAAGVGQCIDLELATVLICSYDRATRELTAATAGHPPPLLLPLAGAATYLDLEVGVPIGVGAGGYQQRTVRVSPGTTVCLFSDGLVERRGESITDGLERLRTVAEGIVLPLESTADQVLAGMTATGGRRDDVALLLLRHQ